MFGMSGFSSTIAVMVYPQNGYVQVAWPLPFSYKLWQYHRNWKRWSHSYNENTNRKSYMWPIELRSYQWPWRRNSGAEWCSSSSKEMIWPKMRPGPARPGPGPGSAGLGRAAILGYARRDAFSVYVWKCAVTDCCRAAWLQCMADCSISRTQERHRCPIDVCTLIWPGSWTGPVDQHIAVVTCLYSGLWVQPNTAIHDASVKQPNGVNRDADVYTRLQNLTTVYKIN